MSDTRKPFSDFDQTQILQKVYNPSEGVLAVGSFLTAQVGNSVQWNSLSSSSEAYSFYENNGANLLYTLTIIYTDSTKNQIQSVTRTA